MSSLRRSTAASVFVALLLAGQATFAATTPVPHPPTASAAPSSWEVALVQVRALLAHIVPALTRPPQTTQCSDNSGAMDPDGHCKP